MIRNVVLMLLAMCFLAACNETVVEQPKKIGVVDIAQIFRESAPAKAGVKFLEGIQADAQKQLTELQDRMQKDPENTALQQEVQTTYTAFQQRIGAEEQNVVNLLQDALQRTIDQYRETHKLDLIVGAEVALSYDKVLDVTKNVIAEMDKQVIEFKAVVPENPQPVMVETPMESPSQPADKPESPESPESVKPEAPVEEQTPSTDDKPTQENK